MAPGLVLALETLVSENHPLEKGLSEEGLQLIPARARRLKEGGCQ